MAIHMLALSHLLMVFYAIAVKTLKNSEILRENWTELPVRIIVLHVTLPSVDSYRSDSHCLARLFDRTSACPTQTRRLWCFADSQSFCQSEKPQWGRTRQRPAITDFHRKENKFCQRFPECKQRAVPFFFFFRATQIHECSSFLAAFCVNNVSSRAENLWTVQSMLR